MAIVDILFFRLIVLGLIRVFSFRESIKPRFGSNPIQDGIFSKRTFLFSMILQKCAEISLVEPLPLW